MVDAIGSMWNFVTRSSSFRYREIKKTKNKKRKYNNCKYTVNTKYAQIRMHDENTVVQHCTAK